MCWAIGFGCAAPLASYAKQAKDDQLEKMAARIRARATRRAGEILKQIEPARGDRGGGRGNQGGATVPLVSSKAAAADAGLSERQQKQAQRDRVNRFCTAPGPLSKQYKRPRFTGRTFVVSSNRKQMHEKRKDDASVPSLSGGTFMTKGDLPATGTSRWVARRKSAVVKGVTSGLITATDAQKKYGLSEEELEGWISAEALHGLPGLKVTLMQHFRNPVG